MFVALLAAAVVCGAAAREDGFGAKPAGLGPGSGPWITGKPEAHGLSTAALAAATNLVAQRVPERYCTLVVKDGVIVSEAYFNNQTSAGKYESDSLAKTLTALAAGAGVHNKLFELDTPIHTYGVKPTCMDNTTDCWKVVKCSDPKGCPTGPLGYWPNMTARAILSQSSGCVTGEGCTAAPGTAFTYDSEQYIEHISYLIGATSKMRPIDWVSKMLTSKLGLPDFYSLDDLGPDFSAGGGQLVGCRDVARFAQLILNKGMWPSSDGAAPAPLIDSEYIAELLTPQYPNRGFSYGLLTWLNAKRDPAVSPPCCAPRWGPSQTCSNSLLNISLLGDGIADIAPHDIGLAMGWLGQYLMVIPSRNMSIVSLGATWGSSVQCPLGAALPTDPAYNDGYDDAYSASQLFKVMDKACTPATHPLPTYTPQHPPAPPSDPTALTNTGKHTAAPAPAPAPAPPAPIANIGDITNIAAAAVADGGGGSCTCLCPPGRGFGACYNLPKGAPPSSCSAVMDLAKEDCPAVGIARQCHTPARPEDTNCTAAGPSMRGDIGSPTVWGGHLTCELAAPCTELPNAPGFASATCSCRPQRYGNYGCHWSPDPCTYTPYFPAGTPIPAI